MFAVEVAAEFPYTPEQVFGLMSDIRNEQKWLPGVTSVEKIGAEPVGRGSEFVAAYQGFGTMRIRLTEFAPPRMFACAVAGKAVDMHCRFEYEPTSGGTRMRMQMDVVPHGLWRVFQPVLEWMFTREMAKRPGQIRRGLSLDNP